jgi:hypothetical protein
MSELGMSSISSVGPMKASRRNAVLLTQARLQEVLDYNPKTGIFKWRKSAPGCSGQKAVGTKARGYLQIEVDGKLYRGHILAWLYMKGEFPTYRVVPVNLDGYDTRWKNLRLDIRLKARPR